MPRLTICGNASPVPLPGAGCSCYLVEDGGAKLLLDIGPGSLSAVQAATAIHDLDAVVISHLHLDHWLDLLTLHSARFLSGTPRMSGGARWRLPVFVPPGGHATIAAAFAALQVNTSGRTASQWQDDFEVREVADAAPVTVAGVPLTFVGPTRHTQLNLGVRVGRDGHVLGYTGDTARCDEAVAVGRDAALFLAECTLLDPGPASAFHSSAGDLVAMAAEARPARLVATHFNRLDPPWRAQLSDRLSALDMPVALSRVGDVYDY